MKNATSLVKINANRKNSLKSTGPKTQSGKIKVRWNALKHGLLSKEIVITAGDGKENKSKFKDLYAQLCEELKPNSILEEILVERIAVCYWRLRRSLRCEIGEIRKNLDNFTWQEFNKRTENANLINLIPSLKNLLDNSISINYLIESINNIQKEVEDKGYISEDSKNDLIKTFGTENAFVKSCLVLSVMAKDGPEKAKQDPENYGNTPPPEICKKALLSTIQDFKNNLELLKNQAIKRENLELEANKLSLALPSNDAIDKILRYETTIERQMYRAINQLARLQMQRNGDKLPPTINVELI